MTSAPDGGAARKDRQRGGGRQAPRAGRRRQAREMALQMLYQWELGGSALAEIFRSFDLYQYAAETSSRRPAAEGGEEAAPDGGGRPASSRERAGGGPRKGSPEAFELACRLVRATVAQQESLDRVIADQAENWRIERMPNVDRNILRLAISEYLHDRELPKVVAIDEAIELAKKFGSEKSGKFVNGVLDPLLSTPAVAQARRAGGFSAVEPTSQGAP